MLPKEESRTITLPREEMEWLVSQLQSIESKQWNNGRGDQSVPKPLGLYSMTHQVLSNVCSQVDDCVPRPYDGD